MTHWTDLRLRRIHQRLEALEAALAQREPRNQCGETCERAKLCATCAQALAQQDEPVREPVAWRLWDEDPQGGGDWRYYDAKDFKEGIDPMKYFDGLVPLYTAPPQRKPLSLIDLQEALVLINLIDRDAIEDPEEYDEGSTLAQIDELYRIIIKERA